MDKKQRNLFVIGILTLVVLLLGATYAYFQVGISNLFGTSTINATADSVGNVTLTGSNTNLTMNLASADMMQGNSNIAYYASSSGATTTPTEEIVGVATVSPTTDTNYYHCTYTLEVSQSYSGAKNMYRIFKGLDQVNNTTYSPSDNELILTVNGVDYDLNQNTLTKEINGEFYIKGAQTREITAGFRLVNRVDKNQNLLAGSGVNISVGIKSGALSCTAEVEPIPASTTLIALTEDTNNASKITRYTGPVTDECSANSCTTVAQAQNVYVFTSNDINNVIFEGFCWKVIRTTETGGIKLLYNGAPITVSGHQECVANNGTNAQIATSKFSGINGGANLHNSPAYVGYMYNKTSGTLREMLYGVTSEEVTNETYGTGVYTEATNVNTTDSALKSTIETWFQTSGIDESKLEDAVYCNDRSLASNSPYSNLDATYTYVDSTTNVYFKNFSLQSTLECTNVTDSFNTTNTKAQTNYKVGFMTTPERYLMGSTPANNGQLYWLGSPDGFGGSASVRNVAGNGSDSSGGVHLDRGVRPVVSTNTGVQITGGEGSTTSPFIME